MGGGRNSRSGGAEGNPEEPSAVYGGQEEKPQGTTPVYDPWALPEFKDNETPWAELSTAAKVKRVVWHYIVKVILLIALLYLFVVSLDFLSSAFKLLGGKTAGRIFRENELLSNPICGLMIGVLVTVLVQSSSTSTSIVITMTANDFLEIDQAVYIIMGANIGTSVTNTIVSLGQVGDREEFRRAFAGAVVHDMFNWLSVIVLLPLEAITGVLQRLTSLIVTSFHIEVNKGAKKDILKVITKPFASLVVKLNKAVIEDIALDINGTETHGSILKRFCKKEKTLFNNVTNETVITPAVRCESAFSYFSEDLSDEIIGAILLVISLVILCICLVLIVKLLHSLLKGTIARVVRKVVNADFPGCLRYLTGYVAIVIGALLTIVVQSSSIFTSTLTPLVGVGVVSLDRMFPLTLGANIGTTATGILASLANSGSELEKGLQLALCHLFFNIFGILIWYPIPFMRQVPINMAKKLGTTTGKYRWFAIVYILLMFFLLPAAVFALSIPGWYVLLGVGVPIVLFIIIIFIINIIQSKKPHWLPNKLRNWDFLPLWMRSLEPLDRVFSKICFCKRCKDNSKQQEPSNLANGHPRNSYVVDIDIAPPVYEDDIETKQGHTENGIDNPAFEKTKL